MVVFVREHKRRVEFEDEQEHGSIEICLAWLWMKKGRNEWLFDEFDSKQGRNIGSNTKIDVSQQA